MLRLSPAQEEQLLQLRKKHLRNLRNLYEDRQRLNLQVSAFPGQLSLSQFFGGLYHPSCASGHAPPYV